jgi:hypothetical protein
LSIGLWQWDTQLFNLILQPKLSFLDLKDSTPIEILQSLVLSSIASPILAVAISRVPTSDSLFRFVYSRVYTVRDFDQVIGAAANQAHVLEIDVQPFFHSVARLELEIEAWGAENGLLTV